jgi:UDP-N-acetyl-D-mannosaminouronate:lipid I N-acetyl-D-mannosaminouronosyltransferase
VTGPGQREAGQPARADLERAPRRDIRGFRIFAFDSVEELLDAVEGRQAILVALNAEKLSAAEPRVQAIANAGIGYPDGYGAVLALRRRGARSARIAGADLWLALVRRAEGRIPVYVVGSRPEVIADAIARLRREHPALEIVGWRDGYLGDGDLDRLAQELRSTKPGIVFVAMGSPRQELVMAELATAWPALYLGLGGSLDVYTGRKRRAPRLVQRLGMEWAYRFAIEPTRLRRLPGFLRFAALLAANRL